jgi:hypothetical protein
MTDAGDGPDRSDPPEPFGLLGHGARAGILRALREAGAGGYDADPLSFSELFERSGIEDASTFDRHLRLLTGQFVAATEAGYTVRYPGRKLLRAIDAGRASADGFDEAAIDGVCPVCEARALTAVVESDTLSVGCRACETPLTANTMPPAGFGGRDVTAALDAYDRLVRHRVGMAVDGVCVECAGRVTGSVTDSVPPGWDFEALVAFECIYCGFWVLPSFGLALLADPDARAFLRTHRDPGVVDRRFWELPLCVTDEYTAVESRGPWRVRVTVPGDGERLVATYDGPTLESLLVESGA